MTPRPFWPARLRSCGCCFSPAKPAETSRPGAPEGRPVRARCGNGLPARTLGRASRRSAGYRSADHPGEGARPTRQARRGADGTPRAALVPWKNGSPHGRGDGRVGTGPERLTDLRFTPTGVGTGRPATRGSRPAPVHPHGRGDWRGPLVEVIADVGSPPRAWGRASGALPCSPPPRFTPTGVGTGLPELPGYA
jgi:hypothetical protein